MSTCHLKKKRISSRADHRGNNPKYRRREGCGKSQKNAQIRVFRRCGWRTRKSRSDEEKGWTSQREPFLVESIALTAFTESARHRSAPGLPTKKTRSAVHSGVAAVHVRDASEWQGIRCTKESLMVQPLHELFSVGAPLKYNLFDGEPTREFCTRDNDGVQTPANA